MQVGDIVYENGDFAVMVEPTAYTVFGGIDESSFARTADGLSIAIACCEAEACRARGEPQPKGLGRRAVDTAQRILAA